MSEFLASLKADLTSRRLAPLLIVAIVGLAAALFYALHVSAHSAPAATVAAASPSGSSSLTVTRASNAADQAVAETANGTSYQHHGQTHDPFTPLASSSTTATTTVTSSSTSSPTTSPSTSTQSATSPATGKTVGGRSQADTGGSTPRRAPTSPEHSDLAGQSTTVYSVSIEQQSLTADQGATSTTSTTTTSTTTATTAPEVQPNPTILPLTILRGSVLPSPQAPMLVYEGVLAGGHYAIFRIIGEVLPAEGGYCLPSPVSCEALKLASGQSERLRYGYHGATVESTLEVTGVKATKETAAAALVFDGLYEIEGKSKLGSSFAGGLHYSLRRGVLVGPHA